MTDKEKYEALVAEIKRLKDETAIGLNERENGVENGRMEVIFALEAKVNSMNEKQSPCVGCEGDNLPGTCATISSLGKCPLEHQKYKFWIGDRIKPKDGVLAPFTIVKIEHKCYIGPNGEHVCLSVQDQWDIVEEPTCDDLEKVILARFNSFVGKHGEFDKTYIDGMAKAAAVLCGKAGANWQHQQMMKGAFVYEKKHDTAMVLASECLRNHGWFSREHDFNDLWQFICGVKELFSGEFRPNDKVKIIAIKEASK